MQVLTLRLEAAQTLTLTPDAQHLHAHVTGPKGCAGPPSTVDGQSFPLPIKSAIALGSASPTQNPTPITMALAL